MTESKHNRTHADQNGNSEFVISGLLPIGKKNAIPSQVLVELVGCGSVRELQHLIAAERKAGAVICSSTTGGYFLPANHRETAEFCKALESRAKNTFIAIQSARRALEIPEGQQDMMTGGEDNGKQKNV